MWHFLPSFISLSTRSALLSPFTLEYTDSIFCCFSPSKFPRFFYIRQDNKEELITLDQSVSEIKQKWPIEQVFDEENKVTRGARGCLSKIVERLPLLRLEKRLSLVKLKERLSLWQMEKRLLLLACLQCLFLCGWCVWSLRCFSQNKLVESSL